MTLDGPTAPPTKPVKTPKNRARLEQLVSQHAAATGHAANRLRNWVSFMVFAGALGRAPGDRGEPLFWFKGGLTMEARFPGPARATRDADAIFRLTKPAVDLDGEPMLDRAGDPIIGIDIDELVGTLERALADPYNGFTFEVGEPQRVKDSVYYEVRIKLLFHGSNWGSVKFEISPPEGSADEPEPVDALPLHYVGLEGPRQLPCLPIPYQIAQKIHAVCQQYEPPRENDRERDLIDLLLLQTLVEQLDVVRDACSEIFNGRIKRPYPTHLPPQTWPPTLTIQDGWRERYPALAADLGFEPADVQAAAQQVRDFISDIHAAATSTS
jgi:hypothetical protein